MEKKLQLQVRRIDSVETQAELKKFHDLIQKRYGPFGKCVLFPSPVGDGGVVCLTSRSEKLFQMLRIEGPLIKLILGNCQSHVDNYKDSGLYSALLATKLIMSGLSIEANRYKVATVTSYFLSLVAQWLRSDTCSCNTPLSLSSKELMSLTRTYLSSKTFKFGLNQQQIEHLSSLLLQAFLSVLPPTIVEYFSFPAHIHVVTHSGQPLVKSTLVHGVAVAISDKQLVAQVEKQLIKRDDDGDILTAVFNVSLAGDFEELLPYVPGAILSSQPSSVSVEGLVLEELLGLADTLTVRGVGMLGCQKVVHPLLKERLREQGVLVVERLSALHIDSVGEVTGGQLNGLITPESLGLGRLKSISLAGVGKDRFLVMEGGGGGHCTLVLCSPTDTLADELEPLCRNTISLLEQSLGSLFAFPGGGCTDTVIAHMATEKALDPVDEEVMMELECDKGSYSAVLGSISKCFSSMATSLEHYGGQVLTDCHYHHCWSFPPYDYCTSLTNSQQSRSHIDHHGDMTLCNDEKPAKQSHRQKCDKGSESLVYPARKCCCGSLTLSNLPLGTKLVEAVSMDTISVPDEINHAMENLAMNQMSPGNAKLLDFGLLDFGLPKVKAIETAGEIAATVLQIGFCVQ